MVSFVQTFNKGDIIGEIESVKSVSNILVPTDGKIIEINKIVIDTPEIINSNPYNDGWILMYETDINQEFNDLLNNSEYSEYIKKLG